MVPQTDLEETPMPIYEYFCEKCNLNFEQFLPVAKYGDPVVCPDCGGASKKLISHCNFNLPGDDFPSKNGRIKKQMAAKNVRLDAKMRDMPKTTLVPNVDGEQTGTWSEAQKLAKDKGKVSETYAPLVAKEKAEVGK
jgi:putative FmdB family regulatory protein